eukprot:4645588-Prymnesium_polylepis.1
MGALIGILGPRPNLDDLELFGGFKIVQIGSRSPEARLVEALLSEDPRSAKPKVGRPRSISIDLGRYPATSRDLRSISRGGI